MQGFLCQSSMEVRGILCCIETQWILGNLGWADLEDPVLASVIPKGWRLSSDEECRWLTSSIFPTDLNVQSDLIWCRALAEKNMCELEGEAMLNECRCF